MKIEKLFGSKTKTDILKYLVFRRQGISIRALENELERSFPAIKKQIDSLCDAEVIKVNKDETKWSISMEKDVSDLIKRIFLQSIEFNISKICMQYDSMIEKYYLGNLFGNPIEYGHGVGVDIVLIYKGVGKDFLEKVKLDIDEVFRDCFVEDVGLVFLSNEDFQRRYRLSDKFVLSLLRTTGNISI